VHRRSLVSVALATITLAANLGCVCCLLPDRKMNMRIAASCRAGRGRDSTSEPLGSSVLQDRPDLYGQQLIWR
jgi:hypothetical protein